MPALTQLNFLSEIESKTVMEYGFQLIIQKPSSDYGFSIMFPEFIFTENPVFDSLPQLSELDIDISFCYGDNDWCNTDLSGSKISKRLEEMDYNVRIIPDSEHVVMMHNPQEVVKFIISCCSSTSSSAILPLKISKAPKD